MSDLFHDKATDWDSRPVPLQISQGVGEAIQQAVRLQSHHSVLDFGAGTGLIASRIAPHVAKVVAVDVSPAMLDKLSQKPELQGKVEVMCQDLIDEPLGQTVDVVVSAMAAHHVQDTAALLHALFAHLKPGGQLALADLDAEDGSFHPAEAEGVFHSGFEREALATCARQAGFVDVAFTTAVTVSREERTYPVFLLTARRPTAA